MRQNGTLFEVCNPVTLQAPLFTPAGFYNHLNLLSLAANGAGVLRYAQTGVLRLVREQDTEKLHQKIAAMSDRIRQLEDALAILQSTHTQEPHPLLQRDQLKIKSIIELHAAGETEDGPVQLKTEPTEESQTIELFGTLAIRDHGAATFYGPSAGQEGEPSTTAPVDSSTPVHGAEPTWSPKAELPPDVTARASSFPFSPSGNLPSDFDFDTLIKQYIPGVEEGWRLCRLYLEQSPWFFGAVTRRQLEEEIFPTWYPDTPCPPELLSRTPHDLALLFIVLTFGAMTDGDAPVSVAETFYTLCKAALSLAPVLERPPSVATVQVLALMGIYEGMNGNENAIEATWGLMGLATKLAQSIGLHRDCARWSLAPAEVQKRRALFWELFITDCWQILKESHLEPGDGSFSNFFFAIRRLRAAP
ncbi:hypothetical protein H0H92_002783 [Tricholoma furcatifolium]|nr:hypothetical protein H0H92_002783 [Tricholoma furcatifolium]